ncbi:6-hydroxyaminopurine reductase [Providencia stuartii]|uniref:6-hydroxyaminopurine reductase n=1 Tax=Providencia TaxID=586 RepID=UPI0022B5EC22|nr:MULTISPECIES: 6-hydroxyaminopurine reductase [Providencia]ELR5143884.1 6-N-hydroxylaminopurine resistance protein [Providencia stuartii]ELZ5940547.1 6-N-hydroxylaminopurine resistance protein [Providencia stuartii]WBA57028.1 6-hydroxyaminopurine reductase [Providencia sp. 21OH12SH02B-Prov]WER22343.1 6-hydroxyaminopurine reductase [Providencia stuartii]WER26463.1 6-hydroxyaminopurine reductase [Providencia stuartii]
MQIHPQVYIGEVKATRECGQSAIHKRQVDGLLSLGQLGLEGDEQAEKRFHGGPDRALCHYPAEHYPFWTNAYPELESLFTPPAFGENISTQGMTEENVFIGDIYAWGDARIQVTQPRSPCYKLNGLTGVENFAQRMQENGRCGWLYRVIKTGTISTATPITLLSRNSDVSVQEAIMIAFHAPFDEELYQRLLGAAGLSASWSLTMQNRLEHRRIEAFSHRLFGKRG